LPWQEWYWPGSGNPAGGWDGDGNRLYDRKKTVMVYDYIDSNVPVLMRMYQKRLKGYRAMGYDVAPNTPEFRVKKISG